MQDGLKILRLPSGRYGYPVTRVGWLRRISGDEYHLIGARTIVRTGAYQIGALDKLAAEGPSRAYQLSAAAALPEEVHRLLIRSSRVCNAEAWAKECPQPKDWSR